MSVSTFGSERDLKQLEVTLSVRKLEDTEKSSYDTQANREVGSSSSLSNIHRLKQGNVSFNYRYYNNTLQKVEVTEDFSCPFCLVKCATFKGLRCHLSMSHDHFNYEFLELEDIPSVNVSVKTNIWKPEIIGDGVDPRIQTYIFCAKRPKRRDQSLLESEILASDTELLEKHDGSNAIVLHTGPDYVPPVSYQDHGTAAVLQVDQEGVSNAIVLHPGLDCVPPVSDHDHGMPAVLQVDQEGVSNAIILHPGPDCVPPISEHDNGTPAVPQVDKRSKLIVERRDPKIVGKLKKRRFYHSHKYQVMELEEVILDDDSEDEINEDAQEIQDRRKVSLLDATNDEKQFIPMWNAFVKKHRVLAEGHINWAFEAFTKYHCADIAQSPALTWRWKAFMIKLSNHGLLKARTLITCNILLEQYRKLNSDISQQLKKFQF